MMRSDLTPPMRTFLAEPRFATFGTINKDGSPHMTVMWYELQDNRLLLNAAHTTQKLANLRRDPRACLVVEERYRYVAIYGKVTLDEDGAATQADILRLAIRYCGEEEGQRLAEREYAHQQRVSIWLTIERIDSIGFKA